MEYRDPLLLKILYDLLVVDDGTVSIDSAALMASNLLIDRLHRAFYAEAEAGCFR